MVLSEGEALSGAVIGRVSFSELDDIREWTDRESDANMNSSAGVVVEPGVSANHVVTATPSEDPSATYVNFRIALDVYILVFLCIFGISGNIVSILVLGKDNVVRRTTGFLLQVLAFTDIVYLVLCIFIQTLKTIEKFTDWIPSLKCYFPYIDPFIWPMASIAQTCTVWLVVVVTADRYVAICRPLHAPQYSTMSRMRKAVVLVFVLSVLYNLPRFWERTVDYQLNANNNTVAYSVKTELRNNRIYVVAYKTLCYFFVRFFVPLTSLAFFNAQLIKAIKKSYKQRQEMPCAADLRNHHRNREVTRYSLTLVVVVVVFILCATPDYFLRIWQGIHTIWPDYTHFPRKQLLYVNGISNLFLAINSCTNFVIYCFLGTRFRRILLEMIGWKRRPRAQSTAPSTFRFSTQWERGEEMTILVPVSNA